MTCRYLLELLDSYLYIYLLLKFRQSNQKDILLHTLKVILQKSVLVFCGKVHHSDIHRHLSKQICS